MRLKNMGGVTPRDRHPDRRKTALAAVAVMLLMASAAKAGQIELNIDTTKSSLGFIEKIYDPSLGPSYKSLPFVFGNYSLTPGPWTNPSNVTSAWGKIYANWNPGASLQFNTLSRVNYNISGVSLPSRDNFGNLNQTPPPAPTQFGLEITNPNLDTVLGNSPTVYGYANIHDMWQTFGTINGSTAVTTVNGGPVLPFIGGINYIAAGASPNFNALLAVAGWEDVIGITTTKIDLTTAATSSTPFPSPYAGAQVTFDGVTLTIPVNYTLTFPSGSQTYEITTFGQLVAHPVVPEPSTMVMLGFGVAGLLGYGWRARKRRNLVA
jgi:hypothetical protein